MLFYAESPGTAPPTGFSDHTAFKARVATEAIDLTRPPLDRDACRWTHPTDYSATQALADLAGCPLGHGPDGHQTKEAPSFRSLFPVFVHVHSEAVHILVHGPPVHILFYMSDGSQESYSFLPPPTVPKALKCDIVSLKV